MEGAFRRRLLQEDRDSHATSQEEFEHATLLLDRALFQFDSTSNHAIMRIYRRSTFIEEHDGKDNPDIPPAEESVFLVYWFVFTLQEFARELVTLGNVMRRVRAREELLARQSGIPLLRWLRAPQAQHVHRPQRPNFRRRICACLLSPSLPFFVCSY